MGVFETPPQKRTGSPHLTEDIWIDEDFKVIKTYDDPKKLAEDLRLSASRNSKSL